MEFLKIIIIFEGIGEEILAEFPERMLGELPDGMHGNLHEEVILEVLDQYVGGYFLRIPLRNHTVSVRILKKLGENSCRIS